MKNTIDASQMANLDTNYGYSRASSERMDPVVSFSSADAAWRTEILSNRDPTFNVGYREDADLGAFLSRPIKIAEYTWTVDVPLNVTFDPWSLFLNNVNVKRRIENFYLLHGDMDIKIMLNGNGFYYGRLLASYSPLSTFRVFNAAPGSSLFNVQASQRPHLFLDPTTSTGGEMFLPYFYPKNWVSLISGEYNKLGTVTLSTLNNLKQANSGSGAINITVFACMKNVDMTIPTVNPVGSISPEGGEEPVLGDTVFRNKTQTPQHRIKQIKRIRSMLYDRNTFVDSLNNVDYYCREPILEDVKPEGGEDEESPPIPQPKRFRSARERDDFLQQQAMEKARELQAEETQPKSRICGDPIAIVAAALAGLSAAGFAREINLLRGRAKQLEKAIADADQLTADITKTYDPDALLDVEFGDVPSDVKPESGKGKGKSGGGGKTKSTTGGSNKGSDEYGTGIISKPASILAKAAGAITDVPVIGKYALASKFALSGIANVARIFGYSRPPIVDNISPMKIEPAGYLSVTDRDEVIAKLALDSKQELSIDPTTVGLEGTDQMALSHVLQKESYLTTFTWQEADTAEQVLYLQNICPAYYTTTGTWGSLSGRASVTPFTHISQLFQNWRGSIVVRFQIVASQFHKGRIRVTWDPYSTNVFDSTSYNIAYNRVIDLAEDRDFEMTIRWGQPEAWKRVPVIAGLQTSDVYSTTTLLPLAERTNGMLQVSVINTLTTPNDLVAAPVGINVFVRAGDDFELANPTDGQVQTLTFNSVDNFPLARRLQALDTGKNVRVMEDVRPESGEESCSNEMTDNGLSSDMDNAPVVVDQINAVGGEMISSGDNTLYVFMGEKVASLRQLMKRYCWHDALDYSVANDGLSYAKWFILNFPALRGYSFQARTAELNSDPYNYTHMTYMNYITPMYAGWRGGIRKKYQAIGGCTAQLGCARDSNSITANGQTYVSFTLADNASASDTAEAFANNTENGRGGAYTTSSCVNPVMEVELPFYSEYRFAHTHSFGTENVLTRYPDGLHHAVEASARNTETGPAKGVIRSAVATAEDFSCFWMLNVPTLYSYDNPPS